MESEISFEKLKSFVSKRKNIFENFSLHPETDEFAAAIAYYDAETIQNAVEAALIDGANPDIFLERMMKECGLTKFEELANVHGRRE